MKSAAIIDFGLTEQQFWALTHREYDALKQRWEMQEERLNWRTALITSWVANSIPRKNKRPYKPSDFMPKSMRRAADKPAQDGEAQYKQINSMMQMFGGRKGRAETDNQRRYRYEVIERYRAWKTGKLKGTDTGDGRKQ